MTVNLARKKGTAALSENLTVTKTRTPALDADVILCSILGLDKTALLFHGERELSFSEEQEFFDAIQKRLTGLPVAYIIGHKEFFGYDFFVTPDVLIPKPDTEILVERVLETLHAFAEKNPEKTLLLCDMCTGSGCIGISVLKTALENRIISEKNIGSLVLADISEEALSVAKKNCISLLPLSIQSKVKTVKSNMFESLTQRFDIIMANPPYVPYSMAQKLLQDGRSEPMLALNGDVKPDGKKSDTDDGLEFMRNFVPDAKAHLKDGGYLICETDENAAGETQDIFTAAGFTGSLIFNDLALSPRCVEGYA